MNSPSTTTAVAPKAALRIGPLTLDVPVVLAPMAGVTNAPFRALCRQYGAGLYVSEMVMARALLVEGAKSWQRAAFASDESPRSMQLYGTDPGPVGEAVGSNTSRSLVTDDDFDFDLCAVPWSNGLPRFEALRSVQAAAQGT